MALIVKDTCDSCHIVVVNEREQMLLFVKRPVLRAELPQQGVDDLKQIHGIEAGMQTFIAFVVGYRVKHGIVHQLIVIAVECLADKEKVRF